MKRWCLLTLLSAACATTTSKYTGKEWLVWNEDDLRDRAAFDLRCDQRKLKLTALSGRMQAGVQGCGRRATYVCNRAGVWVANSH
jgi:hypothetical protein